jgi:hypothetical protein
MSYARQVRSQVGVFMRKDFEAINNSVDML